MSSPGPSGRRSFAAGSSVPGSASDEPFAQTQTEVLNHGDRGLRIAGVELLDESHRDDLGHPRGQPDGQASARIALPLRHVRPGTLRELEDGAGVFEQGNAGIGRNDAPTMALQEPQTQFGLQKLDLPADRRLSEVQRRCGTAEAARLRNRNKILQARDVHPQIMRSIYSW